MPITHIHSYLVHPARNDQPVEIGGTAVDLSGKMFDLLKGIYDRSEDECDIDISFNNNANGSQQNDCHDLLVAYVNGPTLTRGRIIAKRLASFTTHRSHLGLLFLIAGTEGVGNKLIISRFPADSGILAEERSNELSISFLERIFMKSAKAYKAVLYKRVSSAGTFWTGKAVDKQLNSPETELSGYWISGFLDSDFRTTSLLGSRRFALAIRDATKSAVHVDVKSELVAAAKLATGFDGQRLSINSFANRIGLSRAARDQILAQLKGNTENDLFLLDSSEFRRFTAFRTVELSTGGLLTAETENFDRIFHREVINDRTHVVKYSTEGKVVNERIGKTK